ncbi:TIGR01212 family radical SAM protein [Ruminococcus sp. Marseille-P6503]|uniref:TIGR01212 family radical SAM protein n=1 Tax=Ruminococcus sp. Marseille-P6503 TaxID=2364796 RepID=UPI000F546C26|nr:TIGR01212 family radical SAM protein [Ruminococcus sp. Marseille-P6503]
MTQRESNPFEYSDDNKRYLTYSYYLRKRFGKKVFKVPLNIDQGCPNRDGTKGTGGCIFCSAKLSGDFAGDPCDDIADQYRKVRAMMSRKWQDGLCIPYFQAGSNTYGDTETLRRMFETALGFENAAGLSIATRADCIDAEKADMLAELAEKTYLTVELGLQSIHDKTADFCNRCHTFEEFLSGFGLLKERGINVCVHIINGLPFENHDMMVQTARVCGELGIHSIKIHLLHILRNTRLARLYENGVFEAMSRKDYVDVVCDQIELMPEDVIIQRVTGDGAKEELIAPLWSLKKFCVMNEIDKELYRRDSWQGKALKI